MARKPARSTAVEDGADPRQLVERLTTDVIRAVLVARTVVAAESAVCSLFAELEAAAPARMPAPQRLLARDLLYRRIIDVAATRQGRGALGLLRLAATLGPDEVRDRAVHAGDRLAATGVTDLPWARIVGRPTPRRAWRFRDTGAPRWEFLGLLQGYGSLDQAVCLVLDHRQRGGVRDCWVAEGRAARLLPQRAELAASGQPRRRSEDLDLETAGRLFRQALSVSSCPQSALESEDVARWLELVRARVRLLPSPTRLS